MGRTSKPLRILIHPDLANSAEVQALAVQGHILEDAPGSLIWEADLIISPRCWRMDNTLLQYLPLAIKAARTTKYPKGKPDEGE